MIQPDANLPTAIGWQRQFLYGQRYFLERFGIRPTIAYNVDTFGHPATLPDILEAAGCVGYVFHRPTPLQVDLPANVFRWRGPGGGEVMGMRIVPAYVTFGADLSEQILGAAQAVTPELEHVMCFYQVLPPINEQQMVVLNADDEPWEGLIEAEPSLDFDAWGQRWLSDLRGQPVPFQRIQAVGHLMTHRILFPLRVEAREAQQLLLRTDVPPSFSPLETDLDVSPDYLANSRMRVEVDQHGIRQVWLDERPLLSASGISLHLRADGTDTWVMESDAFTRPVESLFSSQAEQWIVEEGGPLRARIRLEGWLGHSRVRWTLSLLRHEPRLFIELDVHFCDHLKLLQMPVHLAETPLAWRDGQAMGAVERRMHVTDRPVEWPVQCWSKMTLSQEHEVALVTNDAYSVSVSEEGGWQWTLLRSPRRPALLKDGPVMSFSIPGATLIQIKENITSSFSSWPAGLACLIHYWRSEQDNRSNRRSFLIATKGSIVPPGNGE